MKLKDICKLIGCAGISKECPGNKSCEILKKTIKDKKHGNNINK